jgi:hypothetical protein
MGGSAQYNRPRSLCPMTAIVLEYPGSGTSPLHILPTWRRWLLDVGTLLAFCVYYLNYGTSFNEGDIQDGSVLSLPLRALAVLAIVLALSPLRMRMGSALLCVALYIISSISILIAVGIHGGLNDTLFFNTLMQLPILVAVTSSKWDIDHVRWLRFVCGVLVLQSILDVFVWQSGQSLWISSAFVGGVGNPSSFGFLCAIGLAFCLLHPRSGNLHWLIASALAIGAVMSKSLLAVLAVILVVMIWIALGRRRLLLGFSLALISIFTLLSTLTGYDRSEELSFIEHKLNAAGAVVGLVEYDIESSDSVSQRVKIHKQTFAVIEDAPQGLLWGHLDGLPYWPMDSQLLTYLGSFGAPTLMLFLALHLYWMVRAWRMRHVDGGFTFVALSLFGLIFATNRILDYYPVASLYFLVVAMVLHKEPSRQEIGTLL